MNKALTLLAATALLMVASSASAATTFLTNNTSPKALASNESDAAALEGATLNTNTALTLSSDDGGGGIIITSTAFTGASVLGMGPTSMGNGNDKWGNGQSWTFQFDQTISFDAIDMFDYNEVMTLQSSAWVGNANATETGWTFDGTTGTFTLLKALGTDPLFDFTSAGVSDVAAGTDIFFGFTGGANGGERMRSFTITPVSDSAAVPEPATLALVGLGMLGLAIRRK